MNRRIIPPPAATATSIRVVIGAFEVEYQLHVTTAPKAYDHSDLITVADDGEGMRWVLIPTRTLEWQMGRNSSGLYPTAPNDDLPPSHLQDFLMQRLYQEVPHE